MVCLTVFVLRCGETQLDVYNENMDEIASDGASSLAPDDDDDDNSESNDENENTRQTLASVIQNGNAQTPPVSPGGGEDTNNENNTNTAQANFVTREASQHQQYLDDFNDVPRKLRLSEQVDPFLTHEGYHAAQFALTCLMTGLSQSTEEERRMAIFAAPTKASVGTAYMMSCSNLNRYHNLRWQLATKAVLEAPCAIPVVVHNQLAGAEPAVARCGGHAPAVQAGLLHCSASPWNDARQKCPMSHVLKKFKAKIQAWVREWKEDDETQEFRRVLDVQYFRVEDPHQPWSLQSMTMKNNTLIDLIDPHRYMTPPRQGNMAAKRGGKLDLPGPSVAVQECVWWARQVGCDTAILCVGEAAMQELAKDGGLLADGDCVDVPPCSLASLVADVPDDLTGASHADVAFAFQGFYTLEDLLEDPEEVIPAYTGEVDILVEPPPDNNPLDIPVNQWSKFPPPAAEYLPADYPDLPPFSQALVMSIPKRPIYTPPADSWASQRNFQQGAGGGGPRMFARSAPSDDPLVEGENEDASDDDEPKLPYAAMTAPPPNLRNSGRGRGPPPMRGRGPPPGGRVGRGPPPGRGRGPPPGRGRGGPPPPGRGGRGRGPPPGRGGRGRGPPPPPPDWNME